MLRPSTILQNRYLIKSFISKGGMGAVYLATDQRLRTAVALKETLLQGDSLRKAFEREARLLANLRHAALPSVMDYFAEGDGEFLVMQYIPGEDLAEAMKRRGEPFPPDVVLGWADQLLDALDYLHSQKPPVIHRDIKPHNLKLTAQGNIILLDFGLAKGTAGQMSEATSGGSLSGYTRLYAPLEQIQGEGTDARSDLFSLSATLYHLMTGEPPADALSRAAAVVNGGPDPLRLASDINPQVPTSVAALLLHAMALKRDKRPASAAEMRGMLGGGRQASEPFDGSTADTIRMTLDVPAPSPGAPRSSRSTNQIPGRDTAPTVPPTRFPATAPRAGDKWPLRWGTLPLITAGALTIALIVAGWWSYQEMRRTGIPAVTSATPTPEAKIPYKVSYPVTNGQWTYPGWDPKQFNERPAEEREELEQLSKRLINRLRDPESREVSGTTQSSQWHAIHMVVERAIPPDSGLQLNKEGRVACSTCHMTFEPVDRIYPRTTCGKCHYME